MIDYYIYILTNKKKGTLYTGITGNLIKRVHEHKNKEIKGFTSKYGLDCLIYYETTSDINSAIQREKRIKKWKRQWKIELIEQMNPEWNDLYKNLLDN